MPRPLEGQDEATSPHWVTDMPYIHFTHSMRSSFKSQSPGPGMLSPFQKDFSIITGHFDLELKKREREIISWLIAPGGSLDLLCVCRNVLFVLETSGDLYWAPQTVVGMCPGLKYLFNHRRALLRNSCTELALYSVEEPQRCLLSDWVPVD